VLGFVWHAAQAGALLPALAGREPPGASQVLYALAAALGLLPLLPKALGDGLEAATVGALFGLSLLLESWSIGRARRAVAALLDLSPREAEVLHEPGAGHGAAPGAAAGAAAGAASACPSTGASSRGPASSTSRRSPASRGRWRRARATRSSPAPSTGA